MRNLILRGPSMGPSQNRAFLRLSEGQRPAEIPAAGPHGPVLLRRPVVDVEQVIQQVQLAVALL